MMPCCKSSDCASSKTENPLVATLVCKENSVFVAGMVTSMVVAVASTFMKISSHDRPAFYFDKIIMGGVAAGLGVAGIAYSYNKNWFDFMESKYTPFAFSSDTPG